MKNIRIWVITSITTLGFAACNHAADPNTSSSDTAINPTDNVIVLNGTYTDLNSGKPVELRKDKETGYVLNKSTGEPVDLYVNMKTKDTFYGRTGTVVNHALVYNAGHYELDETKIKWEGKELKIKDANDDGKVKIEENEVKHKYADGSKVKYEKHEVKRKLHGIKIKKDEDGIKIKRK